MGQVGGVELKRGLKDVYFDTTGASFIDGTAGKLIYRGFNIHDLAEQSTFGEVMYLLLFGWLPTQLELDQFTRRLVEARPIPSQVLQVIDLVKSAHPMDVLRVGVSALAAFDPEVDDNSAEATQRKGIRLTSQAATVVAAHHRLRIGQRPVEPSTKLSHAANFLYMLFGTEPDSDEARILDVDFILHAEHGSNASAFAARVTASTLSDLHAAITTGLGTLKGPLHGGAAEGVMKMAEEIGTPERAEEYCRNLLSQGGRVMGFGHRVYKVEDPRARHLRERSKVLGEKKGHPEWFQILQQVEEKAMAPYRDKGIYVNVDFYAGSIYHLLGIPEDLFVPIFALGRIPGWTLQVMEQFSSNVLLRPLQQYVGSIDLPYIPIAERQGR